jgi:extracellular factor (EF) 3-hydroxypalmitic acid methyl ester biosynthesis protein
MIEQDVLNAAQQFANFLELTDRKLRRTGKTIPSQETKDEVARAYWVMFEVAERYQKAHANEDLGKLKSEFRQIIMPWTCRSRYIWRSLLKPHGYSGDYVMIEWMYDLEHNAGNDPTQPALVNCLDYAFSTNHSVQSLWERRKWFCSLLQREFERNKSLRVFDLGCGGARYIKDFLATKSDLNGMFITLLDQDAAAIEYVKSHALAAWGSYIQAINAPIKHITGVPLRNDYDVIISTGLFDYLSRDYATMLIHYLLSITRPGGILAISNFHPDDKSACAKDWGADWQILFRDETALAELFPKKMEVQVSRSTNKSLAYAWARK